MLRTCQSLTTRWSLPEVIISGRALQCTIIDSCFSLLENHSGMISRITGGSVFCHFCPSKMKVRFFWAAASLPFDGWLLATGKPSRKDSTIWLFQNDSSQNGLLLRSWWNMVKHDNSTKKSEKTPWNHMMWFTMIQFDSVALRRRYLLVSGPEGLGQPRFHAWSVALPRTRMKFHVSVSCHKNTTFDIYIYTYTLAQAFCRSGRFASLKTWKNKKLRETFYNTLRYWSVKKHRDTTLASTRWF